MDRRVKLMFTEEHMGVIVALKGQVEINFKVLCFNLG